MKKLVISATIALLSFMCNAAAVTWSVTAVQATPVGTTPSTSWICYVLSSDTHAAFFELSDTKKAEYAAENNLGSATLLYNARYKIYTASVKEGTYSASSTASAYMVIFDAATTGAATYMAYTTVTDATIGPTGADTSADFGTFATAMAASGSSGGWVPIPEPTSGLLMLLGMAGLALKRKHV